jgi:heme-degrading monooxygenase HmoA
METLHGPASSASQAAVAQAQGVLLAFTNPPPGEDEAFNAAYQEHAAARLRVPGILNARRYRAVADEGPRYMAYYDLESPAAVQRAEYARLAQEASQFEREMFARLPLLDRRVLKLVLGSEPWTEDPPYVLTVALEPAPGTREDFIAWYREEHMPLLLKVPGWRRVRLFEQVEGSGPSFCALQEMESPAVFETEEYRAASATPWRARIIAGVSRRERHLFQLLSTFPRPAWGTR